MDAVVKVWPKPILSDHVRAAPEPVVPKPSREEAFAAVRTLIAYAGDDPDREGLLDTPRRVIDAFGELYRGYRQCPLDVLERTFGEIGKYDDFVLVRDIDFNSHCEHHMMPFMGKAHIAYKPIRSGLDDAIDLTPLGFNLRNLKHLLRLLVVVCLLL